MDDDDDDDDDNDDDDDEPSSTFCIERCINNAGDVVDNMFPYKNNCPQSIAPI